MKLDDNKTGLNSKEFVGIWAKAVIAGEPIMTVFTSKKGKPFQKFALPILLDGKTKAELSSLLRSDLNRIVDAYGTDTAAWQGKFIAYTAVDDGNFTNWQLYAEIPASEETVK